MYLDLVFIRYFWSPVFPLLLWSFIVIRLSLYVFFEKVFLLGIISSLKGPITASSSPWWDIPRLFQLSSSARMDSGWQAHVRPPCLTYKLPNSSKFLWYTVYVQILEVQNFRGFCGLLAIAKIKLTKFYTTVDSKLLIRENCFRFWNSNPWKLCASKIWMYR